MNNIKFYSFPQYCLGTFSVLFDIYEQKKYPINVISSICPKIL